jgi:CrcB protein
VHADTPTAARISLVRDRLTTFSTFSAEVVSLLQQGRAAMASGAVAAHVIGSVVITFLGIGTFLWVNGN